MKVNESVEKHFSERKSHYSDSEAKLPQEKHNPLMHFLEKTLKGNETILDVGCGSGYLLQTIKKKYPKIKLYGIDITKALIDDAKKTQDKSIDFKVGNVMNLEFKDKMFDVVIFKDLLHHLVENTQEDSRENAKKALNEMKRVSKPKGHMFFYEEIMGSKLTSKLIFFVTTTCLKYNISIPFLYIHKYIVVSFLTQKEVEGFMKKLGGKLIEKNDTKLYLRWRYRINLILPIMLRNAKNLTRHYQFTGKRDLL